MAWGSCSSRERRSAASAATEIYALASTSMALALISLFQPSSRAMILGLNIVEALARRRVYYRVARFGALGRRRRGGGAWCGGAVAVARRRRAACGARRSYLYLRPRGVTGPSRREGAARPSQREPWLASGRCSVQQLWLAATCGA